MKQCLFGSGSREVEPLYTPRKRSQERKRERELKNVRKRRAKIYKIVKLRYRTQKEVRARMVLKVKMKKGRTGK